jgi:hypothetical protein
MRIGHVEHRVSESPALKPFLAAVHPVFYKDQALSLASVKRVLGVSGCAVCNVCVVVALIFD